MEWTFTKEREMSDRRDALNLKTEGGSSSGKEPGKRRNEDNL